MLDKYIWGEVKRISQEAPIPVLNVTSEEARPGGAGSVANNLAHLGANVCAGGEAKVLPGTFENGMGHVAHTIGHMMHLAIRKAVHKGG